MQEIIKIESPCDCIVAFTPDTQRPMCHTVLYQVHIDPANVSPSGEFIRFNQFRQFKKLASEVTGEERASKVGVKEMDGEKYIVFRESVNEIHGWKRIDEIEIQEILQEFEEKSSNSVTFGEASVG